MSPTLIFAPLAHVNDVDVGSSKKFFANFSVIGRSKSAKYIVTPSTFGSWNAAGEYKLIFSYRVLHSIIWTHI
jgi:hypothetical protein